MIIATRMAKANRTDSHAWRFALHAPLWHNISGPKILAILDICDISFESLQIKYFGHLHEGG